jgi:hypothetical protein
MRQLAEDWIRRFAATLSSSGFFGDDWSAMFAQGWLDHRFIDLNLP